MNISRIVAKNFGPFASLDLGLSPGLNVVIGDNNTGKTCLLKMLYAATAATDGFALKLAGVFKPHQGRLPRLVKHGQSFGKFRVERSDGAMMGITIPSKGRPLVEGEDKWQQSSMKSVYVPSEGVFAHASGFLSTVARRKAAFSDIYVDLLKQAFLPELKSTAVRFPELLVTLGEALGGDVITKGEYFFLKAKAEQEFTLVSEGARRLALLWLLLRNGSIQPGSVLFWDLPETGLSNKFKHIVASALAEFASDGVQVFVTTNSLFMLREFEIEASSWHYVVRYINLQKTESGVQAEQADNPAEVGLIAALEESLLQSDRYMEV